MRAVPYRKDFVESLKKDPSATEEQVVEDTKESIAKMKTNIDEINRYYAEKGLDSSAVVWKFLHKEMIYLMLTFSLHDHF